jgi:hypothetical protein
VRNLPWNTTKDGVELESQIYQEALDQMSVHGRPVTTFLNQLYTDVIERNEPENDLFTEAKPIAPEKVASQVNRPFEANPKRIRTDESVTIQYSRKKKQVEKVRETLGKPKMPAYKIGEHTFDWFYDRNCK